MSLVAIVVAVSVSGCSYDRYRYYRTYDGAPRSLSNVSFLISDQQRHGRGRSFVYCRLRSIDGQPAYFFDDGRARIDPKPFFEYGASWIELLPGDHSLSVDYYLSLHVDTVFLTEERTKYIYNIYIGTPKTIEHHAEPGKVYRLDGRFDFSRRFWTNEDWEPVLLEVDQPAGNLQRNHAKLSEQKIYPAFFERLYGGEPRPANEVAFLKVWIENIPVRQNPNNLILAGSPTMTDFKLGKLGKHVIRNSRVYEILSGVYHYKGRFGRNNEAKFEFKAGRVYSFPPLVDITDVSQSN